MSHLKGADVVLLGALALLLSTAVGAEASVPADTVWCAGEEATIVGTDGPDLITGTESRDVIAGLDGDDEIAGLGGNDLICGGGGADTVMGGPGSDRIYGELGRDLLFGGNGVDLLHGGEDGDEIHGGRKADVISGAGGNDKLFGGDGDDQLSGGSGGDRLRGRLGVDLLDGAGGKDNCRGEVEHNCEVVYLGVRVDILNGPAEVNVAPGVPFHVWHGWACNPVETDCAIEGAATVSFELFLDDVAVEASGLELVTIVDEWRQERWVFNFPAGMTGIHEFRGVWLEDGGLSNELTVTVTFSTAIMQDGGSKGAVGGAVRHRPSKVDERFGTV